MADLNIDSLKLEIASDSQSADQSIENLVASLKGLKSTTESTAGSLTKLTNMLAKVSNITGLSNLSNDIVGLANSLKHLNGVDVKANGVSSFTNALARLGKTNTSTLASDMNSIAHSITNVGNATTKQNGINSFVNSLIRFSKVNVDTSTFSTLASTIAQIGNTSENGVNAIKSLNSFIRSSEKMKDAAGAFPELSAEIRDFYDALSTIPISDNTVRMAEALAQISQNGGKASTAMSNMTETLNKSSTSFKVATIAVDSIAEGFKSLISILHKAGSGIASGIGAIVSKVKELTSQTPKINQMTFSFKQLLLTLIGFRGLTGVFNWAKDALTLGGDITEIDHIVESVFSENMVGYVEDWANSAIENFGIAAGAAKRYAGTLTAMFQSNNIAMDDAGKMSLRLVELAGDLSAFYNIDTETAYNKIKSGMAGMVRPLRDLGIDLSAATLKEYALAQGIEKNYSKMTQAEKIMLRYKYILEQTETQQSDFKRTSESFANSLRTLRAYLNSVTTQIGVGLAAAIRPAIVALNHLMKYIVAASKAFATFMQTIFGKYKGGASGMAIDASQYEDASDYASDLADGTEDAASGLDDADKAAKKLKKDLSVLPFDELNQLTKDKTTKSKNDDDDGGGASIDLGDLGDYGDGLLGFATDEVKGKLGELETFMSNWGARIKAAFDAKNWVGLGRAMAWGINKGIDELYKILDPAVAKTKILPFLDAFSTTFNSLVDAIEWEKLGKAIGNGINILTASANRILDPKTGINWANIGAKLAEGANGLLSTINFENIGKLFANKLNILWKVASKFAEDFNWGLFGEKLGKGVDAFIKKIDFKAIASTFKNGINGITTATKEFLEEFDAVKYGELLSSTFKDIVNGIKWGEIGQNLAEIWNKAWAFLATAIKGLGNSDGKGTGIGTAIKNTLSGIVEKINVEDMSDALSTFVNKVAEDIQEIFGQTTTWYQLGSKIGSGLALTLSKIRAEDIADAINKMTDALLLLVAGAIDRLNENSTVIFDKLKTLFTSIDWGNVLKLAAPLIAIKLAGGIAGLAFTSVRLAIITKFASMLTGAGGSTQVLGGLKGLFAKLPNAISTVFSKTGDVAQKLGTSVASMFKSVGSTSTVAEAGKSIFSSVIEAIGPGAAEGGLIAAVVAATAEVQKFNDAVRGGNGQITEEGGIWDSFINKLETIYGYSTNDTQAIFDLKEQLENGEISEETFIGKVAEELNNMGVSSGLAKTIVGQLATEVNVTDKQMEHMTTTISGLDTTTEEASRELDLFGNKEDAIKKIGTAFHDAGIEMNNNFGSDHLFTVKQDAITTFTEMARGGTDLKTALSSVIAEFNLTEEEVEALRKQIDLQFSDGMYDTLMTETGNASSKVSGFLGSMQSGTEAVSKAIGFLAEDAKQIPADIATGVTHTQGMPTEIIKKMSGEMLATMTRPHGGSNNEFEEESKEIPKGAATGVDNMTWRAVGSVNTMATEMVDKFKDALRINSPSEEFSDMAENIPKGAEQGITKGQSNAVNAINKLVSALISEFKTKISDLKPAMESSTKEAVGSISDALNDKKDDITDAADDIISAVRKVYKKIDGMQDAMWNAGHNAIQSLANGIKSVNIKMPHIYSNGTYRMWTGPNDYWDIPTYDVEWYAKGSLFTNPSVIGVGEAGTEGVIPLENQKAMGMIADAIVNNSNGSLGIDEQTLVDAVAQGYVRAMMSNAGNQKDPIFHIVCKTESDEVLFRAVQRGKDSIEYRNNPTASYGF